MSVGPGVCRRGQREAVWMQADAEVTRSGPRSAPDRHPLCQNGHRGRSVAEQAVVDEWWMHTGCEGGLAP